MLLTSQRLLDGNQILAEFKMSLSKSIFNREKNNFKFFQMELPEKKIETFFFFVIKYCQLELP